MEKVLELTLNWYNRYKIEICQSFIVILWFQ